MSLLIDGDIEGKISFMSPTELELGTGVAYSVIYEYTYQRSDIDTLKAFNGSDEENQVRDDIIKFFGTTGLNECTIRVEG